MWVEPVRWFINWVCFSMFYVFSKVRENWKIKTAQDLFSVSFTLWKLNIVFDFCLKTVTKQVFCLRKQKIVFENKKLMKKIVTKHTLIVLVGQRIPRWLKLWVGLLGGFIGMCNFVVHHKIHHKIGKKKPLTGLWGWSILWQCGGLAQIRFVGNLQGIEVFRLEVIIAPSTLLLLFPFHGE